MLTLRSSIRESKNWKYEGNAKFPFYCLKHPYCFKPPSLLSLHTSHPFHHPIFQTSHHFKRPSTFNLLPIRSPTSLFFYSLTTEGRLSVCPSVCHTNMLYFLKVIRVIQLRSIPINKNWTKFLVTLNRNTIFFIFRQNK